MVLYKKFLKMFEKSQADKKKLIVEIDAGHPSARTEECIDQVFDFLGVNQLTESEMGQDKLSEALKKESLTDVFYETPSISENKMESIQWDTNGFQSN